ncbi:MAG: zinc ABC transporter substrate-binding protein [Proteobacteria bacterium]|nr:zinc ABC transporter substrate-binding protein [Pseudomonadota bacterium]
MIMRLISGLLLCLVLALPAQAQEHPLRLLAGTTHLADILRDLCPEAEIRTMIPGGACPGHYDLRPGDLVLLQRADALFLHPWQQDLENMRTLVQATANTKLRVEIVDEPGNPMVPAVQAGYTLALGDQLSSLTPNRAPAIRSAAARRMVRIQALDKQLRTQFQEAGAAHHPVACARMQEGLIRWAGFPVAAVFDRPGDMTPEQLARIVDQGRSGGAVLVVDNLQSGDGGQGLAEELAARRVVLSNFPGGFPQTETWEDALRINAQFLLEALNGHLSSP